MRALFYLLATVSVLATPRPDAVFVPLLREPLDAAEIRALGASGDAWATPLLENAFDLRWRRLSEFPAPLPPPHLEEELAACLDALARLDPETAARKARLVLRGETREPLVWEARRALATAGDPFVIREVLRAYFDDPERSRDVLARAALATGDVRLRDFLPPEGGGFAAAEASLRTVVERRLARAVEPRTVRALVAADAPSRVLGALTPHEEEIERALRRRLASHSEREVFRALTGLATRGALGPGDVQPFLDDPRPRVRALAARFCDDPERLRRRLDSGGDRFAAEAARAIVRREGLAGAREIAPELEGRSFRSTLPLLEVLDGHTDALRVQRLVLSLPPRDRARVLERLAETDHVALLGFPLLGSDVDRLHPYLARSRYPAVRERLRRASGARGAALASGLLSGAMPAGEKRALAEAMRDAWSGAVAVGGERVLARLAGIVGSDALDAWLEHAPVDEELLRALVVVPDPKARSRLESLETPEAIERILERSDRVLSVPAFTRLARDADPRVRRAARAALLTLGAGGSTAILRSKLADEGEIAPLFAAAMRAPLEPRLLEEVLEPLGSLEGRSPEAFAGLFHFHERYPAHFLRLDADRPSPLAERVWFVMSLSSDPSRVPILVDMAVGLRSPVAQEAGLLGLAERELGSFFEKRLHRLAGHYDRRVRFLAATALAPSGEPWSVRLLLGELDPSNPFERRRASLALARLAPQRARALLEAMAADGTAGAFGVGELLDRIPREARQDRDSQRLWWELLEEDVARGDPLALLAASRLAHPSAVEAVVRRLREP